MFTVTRGLGRLAQALGLLAVLAAFAFSLLGAASAAGLPATTATSGLPATTTAPTGYVVVQVNDAATGTAVAHGLVSITTKGGSIVTQGKTDMTGYVKFRLPSDSYYVVVEAAGYRAYRVGVALTPDQIARVNVALTK